MMWCNHGVAQKLGFLKQGGNDSYGLTRQGAWFPLAMQACGLRVRLFQQRVVAM